MNAKIAAYASLLSSFPAFLVATALSFVVVGWTVGPEHWWDTRWIPIAFLFSLGAGGVSGVLLWRTYIKAPDGVREAVVASAWGSVPPFILTTGISLILVALYVPGAGGFRGPVGVVGSMLTLKGLVLAVVVYCRGKAALGRTMTPVAAPVEGRPAGAPTPRTPMGPPTGPPTA